MITALLFALLHGLGGTDPFEIPHRFTGGLVLGWLRHRTASLLPCILAHLVHNLLAVIVP
jgi:membrane protease YdiL (CAAX protease family)